ncbi:ATP-binding protein [Embleya scabrispora]|uniref:ATP-binding protein n=1 Tax=Embleya scabrispora TaxID=159449 RepID=UPI0003A1467E|nr:ATP-binding protein [Embleya scabrispora]MYS87904.1 hypothetical protein [Streptomyces sp. SID5474]
MSMDQKPIPVMLSGQALTSLRESGFSFPTAVSEIVDNSIEARANNIHIVIAESYRGRKKVVDEVVVVDDGDGMDDETLQHYMQFGFSTRFMSTKTIGKFGVGAKLAGLSVGTRIEAWTRHKGSDAVRHVIFDLHAVTKAEENGEDPTIKPPDSEVLPDRLLPYFPEGSGTLVLWSQIDNVSDAQGRCTPDHVRTELSKEISRVFRDFLCGGIRITIDGTTLLPHDPTFQRSGTWADHVLVEEATRVAGGPDSAETHFEGMKFVDKVFSVPGTDHEIRVVITVAPRQVVRPRGRGGDELAKKLRVPENQGAISFMRLDREISYTNVPRLFPDGVLDLDRYIGFEVYFTPELDRSMGVRNVKRGAEPTDQMRKTLRKIAHDWIPSAREEVERIWGEKDRTLKQRTGEHETLVKAINDAERTMPKSRVQEVLTPAEELMVLADLAHDIGKESKEEQEAYIKQVKGLPFLVETVNVAGDQLILLTHTADQTIVRLNSRHRFYREMYEPLKTMALEAGSAGNPQNAATARRAVEAILLLLVAYAKAEAQHPTPTEEFKPLRTLWGMFTELYMSKIKDIF